MSYRFFGWKNANTSAISDEYKGIKTPLDLYDALSHIWSADTCAPRMRADWTEDNKTYGQCSITAFLAQDIFGGKVFGILRPGGNYHCYNVIGESVFDLTSEQFGDEVLNYEDNPEQFRKVHFAKEEKKERYELLRSRLYEYCNGGSEMEFSVDVFKKYDKQWALLTAGNEESFNTMTISWGGLGTLWSKPVATVYVRTSRYPHDFMDNNEFFTVSFFPEKYRNILVTLGSKSGRDMDKMKGSGLTMKKAGDSISFEEAETTLVCRKLMRQRLEVDNIPKDIADSLYNGEAPHDMYIGEVVDIIG